MVTWVHFKAPVRHNPTLSSFAAQGGLAHVPVLSRNKALVPSKTLKLPVLSKKSLVTVFSCYTRVPGLPAYVKKVNREDLTLAVLLSVLE